MRWTWPGSRPTRPPRSLPWATWTVAMACCCARRSPTSATPSEEPVVPGRVTHIAVNAYDAGATRAFYEALFEWRFELYYPGFVRTPLPAADEMVAAVQKRRELLPGIRTNGPEVTIEVDDLRAVL